MSVNLVLIKKISIKWVEFRFLIDKILNPCEFSPKFSLFLH